jgi:hypothetical protein
MVTVHFAVDPEMVAFTEPDSVASNKLLLSNTNASAKHKIVSPPRFFDLIVTVKLNTNVPVVGARGSRASSSSSGL